MANSVSQICDELEELEVPKEIVDPIRMGRERRTILTEADRIIHGERLKHYGPPSVNFKRIAESWTHYLGHGVSPIDVCNMMILLKAQRMAEGYHRDTAQDIAGYAQLAAILAGDDVL